MRSSEFVQRHGFDDWANISAFEYMFQAELISKEYSPHIGSIEIEELGGWVVVTGLKKEESV